MSKSSRTPRGPAGPSQFKAKKKHSNKGDDRIFTSRQPPKGRPNLKLGAAPQLENDELQTTSMQTIKYRSTGKQMFLVQDCARYAELSNPFQVNKGAFRAAVVLPGAVSNVAGGQTVFADERGTYLFMERSTLAFKNVSKHDVIIKENTPYCFTLGGSDTNVRSQLRQVLLKPGQSVRWRAKLSLRSNQESPPIQQVKVMALGSNNTEREITTRVMATHDFAIVIPDEPESSGAIVTSSDKTITSERADWNPLSQVVEAVLEVRMKVQQFSNVSINATTVTVVKTPTHVFLALSKLQDIADVKPLNIIPPTVNYSPQAHAAAALRFQSEFRAVTPNWIQILEGNRNYLSVIVEGKRAILFETDDKAFNAVPVALSALERSGIRIVGPAVAVQGPTSAWAWRVYDEYGYDRGQGHWCLYSGDVPWEFNFQDMVAVAQMNKERPIMYYDLDLLSKEKDIHNVTGVWDDIVSFVQGTWEIIQVVHAVGSVAAAIF